MKKNTLFKAIFGLLLIFACIFVSGCVHKHASDGVWEANDEYHWHICSDCNQEFDKAKHTFDEGIVITENSEYREGLMLYCCEECGYELEVVTPKKEHEHSVYSEYESDIEYHWKTCRKCHEVVDKETHTWDSGVKKTEDDITMITYTCEICKHVKVEIENLEVKENILDYASDVVTSDTVDILPSMIGDKTYEWSSSNTKIYNIDGAKVSTILRYQTHKKQYVTVSVKEYSNGEAHTYSKEIIISPVAFKTMENPKAVYFAIGSQQNYRDNSERYIKETTLFSDKFKANMDMVYYSFAYPSIDGTVSISDSVLGEVMELKNSGIRVLVVINGVDTTHLQALATCSNDDTLRAKLVSNIISIVEKYNFDGVDMDWEYPGTSGLSGYTTAVDQINLNKLMRDLRSELDARQDSGGSPYILSAAIPATSWGASRYKFTKTSTVGGLNDYCDYINMMSYDSNNPDYCTHIAPMYSSTQSHDYKFGCAYGAQIFKSYGVSANKIILGAACYGKAYKVSGTVSSTATYPALNNAGTLTQIEGVTGSFKSGTIYYSGIVELMKDSSWKKYTEMNGSNIVGSYLYNSKEKLFVTYESEEAIKAKCEYAKANGMGIMAWAYGEDSTDTIINAICDNMK